VTFSAFGGWLQSLHVVVSDDGGSCHRQREWLLQSGAMVTHAPQLKQAIEVVRARPDEFDLLLIDADAHPQWGVSISELPSVCATLIVCASADEALLRRVLEKHAGYIAKSAAPPDFVFSVYTRVRMAGAPDLDRLVGRASRLWALSPQLKRVLHHNLWGYSDRDIADALSISLKTTQQYQEELRRKTGVKTKQGYLRRLLLLAGYEPPLPVTDETLVRVEYDRERLLAMRFLHGGH
jgi:DNA-binding NarL/FixJ family response regulator